METNRKEKGQTLLIVVLVLAVALTIGLAVVSRSITDIRISRQEEESARVFSAAEAGIENALKQNLAAGGSITGNVGTDINYKVNVTTLAGGQEFVYPEKVEANDVQTLWLMGHLVGGGLDTGSYYQQNQIEVYWGDENALLNPATAPALEVSLYYKDNADYKLKRYAFDPWLNRRNENKFDPPDGDSGYTLVDKKFQFYKRISGWPAFGGNVFPYFLRLRLLYNTSSHFLGVKFAGTFYPAQGKCYESTAVLKQTPGMSQGTTSTTQECVFYAAPPGIFDYVLFSGGDLSH